MIYFDAPTRRRASSYERQRRARDAHELLSVDRVLDRIGLEAIAACAVCSCGWRSEWSDSGVRAAWQEHLDGVLAALEKGAAA